MYCIKCGYLLPDDAVFCQKCGAKQNVSLDKTPATDQAESPIRVSAVSYDETEKQQLMKHIVESVPIMREITDLQVEQYKIEREDAKAAKAAEEIKKKITRLESELKANEITYKSKGTVIAPVSIFPLFTITIIWGIYDLFHHSSKFGLDSIVIIVIGIVIGVGLGILFEKNAKKTHKKRIEELRPQVEKLKQDLASDNQKNPKRQAEIKQKKSELYNHETLSWLPPKYRDPETFYKIAEYIYNKRANTLQEALNLYETEAHQRRLERQTEQAKEAALLAARAAAEQSITVTTSTTFVSF